VREALDPRTRTESLWEARRSVVREADAAPAVAGRSVSRILSRLRCGRAGGIQPDAVALAVAAARDDGGRGEAAEGARLREMAFEQAPTTSGSLRTGSQQKDDPGTRFSWIADADTRLGPVLEAIINGRYYWIPFARLSMVAIDAPADLRDSVWMPAHLGFENGGESVALIPTRYPGSESSEDGQVVLSRKTLWQELSAETFAGLGQRVLTTDAEDFPLMDVRSIEIEAAATDANAASEG